MKRVVVTGSLGYDNIMNFRGRFADRIMPDKVHKISLGFLAQKLSKQFGGTAGNFTYTAKLLGLEPLLLACGGNDFDPYKQFLTRHKITTKYIRIVPEMASSTYFVVTDQDDNQIGSYFIGPMDYADQLRLADIKEPIDLVHISPNKPRAMKNFVIECQIKKLPFMYDPAFQIADFSADDLRQGITGCSILIANDYEFALIEQKLGISHDKLIDMAPIVVTTLGSKGSVVETKKEKIHINPAKPKNTSDPTGAGDAYRAGFVAGYLRILATRPGLEAKKPFFKTQDLVICGRMGSVAAAYTVEQYGTVTHHFTKKEFEKRYKENYGTTIHLN